MEGFKSEVNGFSRSIKQEESNTMSFMRGVRSGYTQRDDIVKDLIALIEILESVIGHPDIKGPSAPQAPPYIFYARFFLPFDAKFPPASRAEKAREKANAEGSSENEPSMESHELQD